MAEERYRKPPPYPTVVMLGLVPSIQGNRRDLAPLDPRDKPEGDNQ
jgi:hypothetical protein